MGHSTSRISRVKGCEFCLLVVIAKKEEAITMQRKAEHEREPPLQHPQPLTVPGSS